MQSMAPKQKEERDWENDRENDGVEELGLIASRGMNAKLQRESPKLWTNNPIFKGTKDKQSIQQRLPQKKFNIIFFYGKHADCTKEPKDT